VILHVGRLAPEKNVDALVAAYFAVKRACPRAVFVFVGDGPSRGDLAHRCRAAVFAGMRSGVDLATHYASGDVFLFPSTTETFGNVTAEAMASGLAVVAYDYAAARALIDNGVSGLLAPLDDAGELLRLACFLAQSPGEVDGMRVAARRAAELNSWDRVVEQLEAEFVEVVRDAEMADRSAPSRTPSVFPYPIDYR
jgi:glycosyltransferase involved in cell wall biosynthesis